MLYEGLPEPEGLLLPWQQFDKYAVSIFSLQLSEVLLCFHLMHACPCEATGEQSVFQKHGVPEHLAKEQSVFQKHKVPVQST